MGFIYTLNCKECDTDLEYEATIDNDMDLIIHVEPCSECVKEAGKAGEDKIKVIDVVKSRGLH